MGKFTPDRPRTNREYQNFLREAMKPPSFELFKSCLKKILDSWNLNNFTRKITD